jgi:hypothetical protein
MSSNILELHNQNLVKIMQHLEHNNDPRARQALAMAKDDQFHPLNETALQSQRSDQNDTAFDADIFNSPILYGADHSPFSPLPTAAHVQTILTQDITHPNLYDFAPSRGSPQLDAAATTKLLANIPNPAYAEPGAILHMSSPTFDALRTNHMPWESAGILGTSAFQMTVSPAPEVFDLEFSPNYFFTTLMTGLKVWIAYPPRHGNLMALQRRYEALAGGSVFLALADTLQHGIALIQRPGETLMLPPYWLHMSFSVECSTSAGYFLATALKYIERLLSIDLHVSGLRMWDSEAVQQSELVSYVEMLAEHLDVILNQSEELGDFKNDGVVSELCMNWDKVTVQAPERGTLKVQVCRLCSLIEDEDERRRIQRIWQRAWLEFMLNESRRKDECRICGVKVAPVADYRLPGMESLEYQSRAHFVMAHWVAAL